MENNNGNVYGNAYGNAYVNYNTVSYGGQRKFDVRGLVTTIYCLVMSLIVALSTLMPMITIGTGQTAKSFNIVEEFKIISEFIDLIKRVGTSYMSDREEIIMVVAVVVFMIPLAIMIMGIISTIVYIVKLVSGRYSHGSSSFAWGILILEMMMSTFQLIYLVVMTEILNYRVQGDDYGLSVGWYLPVIFAFILLVLNLIMDMIEASKNNKVTLERIFALIASILTVIMYFSFSSTFFTIARTTEEIDVSFSALQLFMISELDVSVILINVFLVIVAIFVHICVVKNMNAMISGKFGSVTNILTSVFAIVFTIINYIIFDIYVADEYSKYTMSMSVGNYMYIIMGSSLLVLTIVYLCIKGVSGGRQDMIAYQQYANYPQQGMQYAGQQPGQNVNYVNQQMVQNRDYVSQQPVQNRDYVNQQPMQGMNYVEQQQTQNLDYSSNQPMYREQVSGQQMVQGDGNGE